MLNEAQFASTVEERQLLELARQEIQQLRHWYGVATDLLGRGEEGAADPEAQARGRAIYERIFSPNAKISVRGSPTQLTGEGPNAWGDVATGALAQYAVTQHLIGTQVVSFTEVGFAGKPKSLQGGRAEMRSYLQAWHATPERHLRLVLGTYEDSVRFNAGVGWQIETMVLDYASGEKRDLGEPP